MQWCGRLGFRASTGDAHHHCDCSCIPHRSHSKVVEGMVEGVVEEEVEEEVEEQGVEEEGPLASGTCLASPAQPMAMQPGRREASSS